MTHALKCYPQYFADLHSGNKTFELRKEDRPFEVGDTLIIQEYDPESTTGMCYSGRELTYIISYILRDAPKFGLKPGFAILGLKIEPPKPKEQ